MVRPAPKRPRRSAPRLRRGRDAPAPGRVKRRRGDRIIGLISDTHGLVRPEALLALRGSELIIHAGDIGGPEVLETLRSVAPVVAVRGNNDRGPWAGGLKDTEIFEVGGVTICVLHRIGDLDRDPAAARFRVVISGHSHRPSVREVRGVLYVNPGSAGPRRFSLPIAVGLLRLRRGVLTATIRELAVPATGSRAS